MSKQFLVALVVSILSLNAAFANCGCSHAKKEAAPIVEDETTAAAEETASDENADAEIVVAD